MKRLKTFSRWLGFPDPVTTDRSPGKTAVHWMASDGTEVDS